mgnify:CR=1 FL=1
MIVQERAFNALMDEIKKVMASDTLSSLQGLVADEQFPKNKAAFLKVLEDKSAGEMFGFWRMATVMQKQWKTAVDSAKKSVEHMVSSNFKLEAQKLDSEVLTSANNSLQELFKKNFSDDNLASPGLIIGTLMAAQAAFRQLSPGETRGGLALKCSQGVPAKEFMSMDSKFMVYLQQLAK